MILVIDNYDSFTYNLVHYIGEFENDQKQGFGVQISLKSEDRYEGNFSEDSKNGQGTLPARVAHWW